MTRARRRRRRDHRPGRRLRVAPPASRRRDRRPRGGEPDRRQAAAHRAGRPLVRHRARGDARPRAGGGPAGRGPRPRRPAGRARDDPGVGRPAGRTASPPRRHGPGRPGLGRRARRPPVHRRRRAGAGRGRRCRRSPWTATSPSVRCCARGSATRWSTGWWSRCSAGSTPGGPTSSPSPRRCPRWRPSCRRAGSVLAAAAAARDAGVRSRGDDDGPVFATVSDGIGSLPAALVAAARRGGPAAHARPRAPAHGDRLRAVDRPGRVPGGADRRPGAGDRARTEGRAPAGGGRTGRGRTPVGDPVRVDGRGRDGVPGPGRRRRFRPARARRSRAGWSRA